MSKEQGQRILIASRGALKGEEASLHKFPEDAQIQLLFLGAKGLFISGLPNLIAPS